MRALQLANANRVVALPVALRVQRVEHLIESRIIANAQFTLFTQGYYVQEGVGCCGGAGKTMQRSLGVWVGGCSGRV